MDRSYYYSCTWVEVIIGKHLAEWGTKVSWSVCSMPSEPCHAKQNAVVAYFPSKPLLPFGFAERSYWRKHTPLTNSWIHRTTDNDNTTVHVNLFEIFPLYPFVIPANIRRWPNVGLMLAHRLAQHQPNIGQTPSVCLDSTSGYWQRCTQWRI